MMCVCGSQVRIAKPSAQDAVKLCSICSPAGSAALSDDQNPHSFCWRSCYKFIIISSSRSSNVRLTAIHSVSLDLRQGDDCHEPRATWHEPHFQTDGNWCIAFQQIYESSSLFAMLFLIFFHDKLTFLCSHLARMFQSAGEPPWSCWGICIPRPSWNPLLRVLGYHETSQNIPGNLLPAGMSSKREDAMWYCLMCSCFDDVLSTLFLGRQNLHCNLSIDLVDVP